MRDSHTISRFSGVNAYDSPMNVKPHYAQDCRNVIGDESGDLWVARLTQKLIDFTKPGPPSFGPILSLGLLDDQVGGNPLRVITQQEAALVFADAPAYANPTACTGLALPANPGRLTYAQSASVLYFSSGKGGGKLLPGDPQVYRWGIVAPVLPVKQVASTTFLGVVSIQRVAGVTTLAFTLPHGALVNDPVFVDSDPSATWDASYAGTFKIASVVSPTAITYANPGPDSGPFARAVYAPGITATTGYQYYGSFGFSKTGHWSTVGPLSVATGPLTQQSPALISPVPPDPQDDRFALFRNFDGGGDWYLIGTYNLVPAGPFPMQVVMVDSTSDDTLEDQAQTPPYDNGVSPNGKYIAASVDRILMCGIPGNLNAVAFSGYDSINFGRPQESWPTFNSLAVGQGQAIPNGLGLTRYGWVIFTNNRSLFILRGTLQDVTVSAVQTPSFQLSELPFKIGCYSHYGIQQTPSGLVFLDDALKLKVFDGYWEPQSIAPVLNGFLKRITPGSQDIIASAYVEYLNRTWYILSVPLDGATSNNTTFIVDVDADQERNTGCWVTSYAIDDLVSALYRDGTRHILCAQSQSDVPPIVIPAAAGWLTELPLLFSANDGLGEMPNAHYLTGYFGIKDEDGIDEWGFIKMFRYLRETTNLPNITVMACIVDGSDYTFDNPLVQKFDFQGTYGAINMKGRAIALDFIFPPNSADALSAITQAWNFCGKR